VEQPFTGHRFCCLLPLERFDRPQDCRSGLKKVFPEFAWMAEKTTGLARASCSTKEHIRAIDGSVPVEQASNLLAGPCRAEMAEIEVA